jgi:hypothetical protein
VPHPTVGERRLGDRTQLEQAEREIAASLPVRTYVDRVLLIAGAQVPMSWRVLNERALAQDG